MLEVDVTKESLFVDCHTIQYNSSPNPAKLIPQIVNSAASLIFDIGKRMRSSLLTSLKSKGFDEEYLFKDGRLDDIIYIIVRFFEDYEENKVNLQSTSGCQ
jgi:hypothetical protein